MSNSDKKQSLQPAGQALELLVTKHAASRKPVVQSSQDKPALRIGLIDDINSTNLIGQWLAACDQFQVTQLATDPDLSATKIQPTAEKVISNSIVRDTFDVVVDLSNDTNESKASSLAQARRLAAADCLFLIRSETQTVTDLLPDVQQCMGIATGEWSGHRFIELIAVPATTSQVIERAFEFSEQCADAVMVTRGHAQSMLWKIQCSYLVEALALVGEAASAEQIEQFAADAGMREPPLMALDQISLKLMDHILHDELHRLSHAGQHAGHHHDHGHHSTHEHEHDHKHHDHSHHHVHDVASEQMPESAVYVLEKMAHGFDRLGAQFGAGFYDYDYDDDPPELWDGLSAFARGANRVDPNDIADRLRYAPAIQFLHCMNDGFSDDVDTANLGAIIGAGYSAQAGGPVGFIRGVGQDRFAVRAGELAGRYGHRFELPEHWQSMLQSES